MAALDKNIKYLGIDWGKKRIGLSLGHSETKMATPYKVALDVTEIKKIITDEEIDELVIGEPFKKEKYAPLDPDFTKFFDKINNQIQLPIHLVDERLSSRAADALPGNKKTKASRDEIAAMLILQSYLDQLSVWLCHPERSG